MVNRHEVDHIEPLTVVDIDGTYINGNTLTIYYMCGLRHLFELRRFLTVAKLLAVVAIRKLRLISHLRMKTYILNHLFPYDDILSSFAIKAKERINPQVAALVQNESVVLLASAAPSYYIEKICDGMPFVASAFYPGKSFVECRGEEKLRRVNEWAAVNDCCISTVVSDHYDDAPLIKANKQGLNILVNPSKKTLRFFRKLQPTHFFLIEEISNLSVAK